MEVKAEKYGWYTVHEFPQSQSSGITNITSAHLDEEMFYEDNCQWGLRTTLHDYGRLFCQSEKAYCSGLWKYMPLPTGYDKQERKNADRLSKEKFLFCMLKLFSQNQTRKKQMLASPDGRVCNEI